MSSKPMFARRIGHRLTQDKPEADYCAASRTVHVYLLWLVDDSVETPEGIYIGASQADVEAAYGAESYNGSNAYIITGDHTRLTVILENGVVSSIQYDAVI